MVQLAFYYANRGSLLDKAVSWWTQGPFSHSEIVFSDGECFSSSWRDKGVRFKWIDLTDSKWCLLSIPGIDAAEERRIRNWCLSQVGKKYDFRALLRFFVRPVADDREKWTCSEINARALRLSPDPALVSPNDLYKLATAYRIAYWDRVAKPQWGPDKAA